MSWDPITGVCVVEDKTRAPLGYDVISTTTDNCEADLWRDKKLRRKITRYLAITRTRAVGSDKVLADISVIKEDQVTPPGYICITVTQDTGEQVLKKKSVIFRLVDASETNEAVTDIYLTSGKAKSKPVESTYRGWELKDLALYLRYGPVIKASPPVEEPSAAPLPYQFPVRNNSLNSTPVPLSYDRPGLARQSTLRSPEHKAHMSAIDGVPFEVHPILLAMALPDSLSVPTLHLKTSEEILRTYQYDFSTEYLVKKQAAYTS